MVNNEWSKKGTLRNCAVLVKTLRLTTTNQYPLTAPWKIRPKPLKHSASKFQLELLSASSKIPWSAVSKASLRSGSTKRVTCWLFILRRMSFFLLLGEQFQCCGFSSKLIAQSTISPYQPCDHVSDEKLLERKAILLTGLKFLKMISRPRFLSNEHTSASLQLLGKSPASNDLSMIEVITGSRASIWWPSEQTAWGRVGTTSTPSSA